MNKQICLALVSTLVVFGCDAEGDDIEALERSAEIEEIVENLELAGYPASEIDVTDEGIVMVGGDAVVTLGASREMVPQEGFRQYRTTNLVDAGVVQTICVDGSALNGTLSAALDQTIANYNNDLNLSFDFVRSSGGGSCDAVIDVVARGPAGGQAGFPEGGMPYTQVQIGKSTGSYGVDVASHVLTHELGHCIGLRHSDYYNRAISCGSGGNEGQAGVGAIHIQGTPTNAVFDGSVMNSCFHTGSTGEFTASDVTAFNALY